jgi:hypothetical protein
VRTQGRGCTHADQRVALAAALGACFVIRRRACVLRMCVRAPLPPPTHAPWSPRSARRLRCSRGRARCAGTRRTASTRRRSTPAGSRHEQYTGSGFRVRRGGGVAAGSNECGGGGAARRPPRTCACAVLLRAVSGARGRTHPSTSSHGVRAWRRQQAQPTGSSQCGGGVAATGQQRGRQQQAGTAARQTVGSGQGCGGAARRPPCTRALIVARCAVLRV